MTARKHCSKFRFSSRRSGGSWWRNRPRRRGILLERSLTSLAWCCSRNMKPARRSRGRICPRSTIQSKTAMRFTRWPSPESRFPSISKFPRRNWLESAWANCRIRPSIWSGRGPLTPPAGPLFRHLTVGLRRKSHWQWTLYAVLATLSPGNKRLPFRWGQWPQHSRWWFGPSRRQGSRSSPARPKWTTLKVRKSVWKVWDSPPNMIMEKLMSSRNLAGNRRRPTSIPCACLCRPTAHQLKSPLVSARAKSRASMWSGFPTRWSIWRRKRRWTPKAASCDWSTTLAVPISSQ